MQNLPNSSLKEDQIFAERQTSNQMHASIFWTTTLRTFKVLSMLLTSPMISKSLTPTIIISSSLNAETLIFVPCPRNLCQDLLLTTLNLATVRNKIDSVAINLRAWMPEVISIFINSLKLTCWPMMVLLKCAKFNFNDHLIGQTFNLFLQLFN